MPVKTHTAILTGLLLALITGPLAAQDLPAPATLPRNSSLQLPSSTTPLQTAPLNSALPAEQAFALSVIVELPDHIVAIWDIREGYYLYRKSLQIEEVGENAILGEPLIPRGKMINDQFFGDVEVYRDRLLLRIPITRPVHQTLELSIQFQGCAEIGYCYPMQFRQVDLDFSQ